MALKCDNCGEITHVLVDGYLFGDRQLEGVMFIVMDIEGEPCCSGVKKEYDSYFMTLNRQYWIDACTDFCRELDIAECPICGEDVAVWGEEGAFHSEPVMGMVVSIDNVISTIEDKFGLRLPCGIPCAFKCSDGACTNGHMLNNGELDCIHWGGTMCEQPNPLTKAFNSYLDSVRTEAERLFDERVKPWLEQSDYNELITGDGSYYILSDDVVVDDDDLVDNMPSDINDIMNMEVPGLNRKLGSFMPSWSEQMSAFEIPEAPQIALATKLRRITPKTVRKEVI